ncbi:MAG: hypothetical protein ACREQV_19315 [Candidatus Binatia bacterium]
MAPQKESLANMLFLESTQMRRHEIAFPQIANDAMRVSTTIIAQHLDGGFVENFISERDDQGPPFYGLISAKGFGLFLHFYSGSL